MLHILRPGNSIKIVTKDTERVYMMTIVATPFGFDFRCEDTGPRPVKPPEPCQTAEPSTTMNAEATQPADE